MAIDMETWQVISQVLGKAQSSVKFVNCISNVQQWYGK